MNDGPIYLDGMCLARRSIVLNIDFAPKAPVTDDGNVAWTDLSDCINMLNHGLISTKDKYIVIGSFVDDDIHSTY